MAPIIQPIPSLSDLPLRKGDPPNSAWGLWGDGPESALGSLNYLTEEVVAKAAREEIQTGERVGLEYASKMPEPATRPHQIVNLLPDLVCPWIYLIPLCLAGQGFSKRSWIRTR